MKNFSKRKGAYYRLIFGKNAVAWSWPRSNSTTQTARLRLDVTDEKSIAAAVVEVTRRFGGIGVLINNMGVAWLDLSKPSRTNRSSGSSRQNFFAAVAVTRAVIPQMRERREGTIINVTWITGRFGLPFMSPYDATKYAIEGMSE
jgi:NAD(P)-dependent dehydrogenase (short-subunit alcohol dehydrogenase family)